MGLSQSCLNDCNSRAKLITTMIQTKTTIFFLMLFQLLWLPKAAALELGELETDARMNQPFKAQIKIDHLDDIQQANIIPVLANDRLFEKAGIIPHPHLIFMEFEVKTIEKNHTVIDVQLPYPIEEPFLHFIIEVYWPSGYTSKEYAVLVDP